MSTGTWRGICSSLTIRPRATSGSPTAEQTRHPFLLEGLDNRDGYVVEANAPPLSNVESVEGSDGRGRAAELVGIPSAAPSSRNAAGEAVIVFGPDTDDCRDYNPTPATGDYALCDDLGRLDPAPNSAPDSNPPAQAAGVGFDAFPSFGTDKIACRDTAAVFSSGAGYYCQIEKNKLYVDNLKTGKFAAMVRVDAKMRVAARNRPTQRLGRVRTAIIWKRGAKIRQRVAVRCRIDLPNVDDENCSEGPNFDKTAITFNRRRFGWPNFNGRTYLLTGHPLSYQYKFYEFAFLFRVGGACAGDFVDGCTFRYEPDTSMQSPRFRCFQELGSTLADCRFNK